MKAKRIILVLLIILVAVVCVSCSSARTYNGNYEYASVYTSNYKEETFLTFEPFSSVEYKYGSKDDISFSAVGQGDFEEYSFSMKGAVVGDISEDSDRLDMSNNKRYTTYSYRVNFIDEAGEAHRYDVYEYWYESKTGSYVKIYTESSGLLNMRIKYTIEYAQ